jgi:hypothetical protein
MNLKEIWREGMSEFKWLRIDPQTGSCQHDKKNETLDSTKTGNFFTI